MEWGILQFFGFPAGGIKPPLGGGERGSGLGCFGFATCIAFGPFMGEGIVCLVPSGVVPALKILSCLQRNSLLDFIYLHGCLLQVLLPRLADPRYTGKPIVVGIKDV